MSIPLRLSAPHVADSAFALADLFVDAVADGASIGYMAGLARNDAARYWHDMANALEGRAVFAVHDDEGIAGVVIVVPIVREFQPHRAEVAKLVVHRRARGRGLGNALLAAAEQEAAAMGRPLLTLMTRHGSDGERLYRRRGWALAGVIPQDSLRPDGSYADAAIYWKRVGG